MQNATVGRLVESQGFLYCGILQNERSWRSLRARPSINLCGFALLLVPYLSEVIQSAR